MTDPWSLISNLGDAALTVPLAIVTGGWLCTANRRLGLGWIAALGGGALLVGLTKILYAGCGVQIRTLDFRVISGHTTLAAATWTVIGAIAAHAIARAWLWRGAALGFALSVAIGVARIADGSHSPPEVIIAWLLGGGIAVGFLTRFARVSDTPRWPVTALGTLLLITLLAYGHHAPLQGWIQHYSPWLCGRPLA